MTAELPPNLADYFNLPAGEGVEYVDPVAFESRAHQEAAAARTGRLIQKAEEPQEMPEENYAEDAVDLPVEDMSGREQILADAWQVVTQDRNVQYGPPEDSFTTIAGLWSTYLGLDLLPHDVAAMMVLMKVARLQQAPFHRDSWVDVAGYAACGGGFGEPEASDEPA